MMARALALLVVTCGALWCPATLHAQAAPTKSASQGPAAARTAPAAPTAAAALREAEQAFEAGDLDKALALAERQAKAATNAAAARVLAARVHLARGNLDNAYESLRQVIATQPRHVDALYYMGVVSGRLAEQELERLTTIAPDSARVHQVLAEGLELQERRSDAIEAYEAALQRDPKLLDALLALGKLRRIALQCDQAVTLYERAQAIRPTFEGAYGLGVCLSFDQEDERAAALFRQALEFDPKAPLAWLGLGMSVAKLGRTADAIQHLQRAIALEPRMSEAHYALGQAYQRSGDAARAQAAFAEAARVRSRTPATPEPR